MDFCLNLYQIFYFDANLLSILSTFLSMGQPKTQSGHKKADDAPSPHTLQQHNNTPSNTPSNIATRIATHIVKHTTTHIASSYTQ